MNGRMEKTCVMLCTEDKPNKCKRIQRIIAAYQLLFEPRDKFRCVLIKEGLHNTIVARMIRVRACVMRRQGPHACTCKSSKICPLVFVVANKMIYLFSNHQWKWLAVRHKNGMSALKGIYWAISGLRARSVRKMNDDVGPLEKLNIL
jgi:hypothetical protein